jgi:hypothetical protein
MKKLKIFNHELEFFWGEWRPAREPVNIRPFFGFATFFLFLSLVDVYNGWKDTVSIHVLRYSGPIWTDKDFALPGNNSFVADRGIGELVWHPQSLWQAFILNMTDNDSHRLMDVFDALLLYMFVFVFYWMTRNNKSNIIFTKKVSKGFQITFLMIAMIGVLEGGKHFLLYKYIEHMTNGQFTLPPAYNTQFYLYLGIMLIILSQFTDRAAELQEEQALTI